MTYFTELKNRIIDEELVEGGDAYEGERLAHLKKLRGIEDPLFFKEAFFYVTGCDEFVTSESMDELFALITEDVEARLKKFLKGI
jgi:hypothetical protein